MAAAQARHRAAGQTKPVCGRAGRADWAGEEFRIGAHQPGRRGAAKVKIAGASESSYRKIEKKSVIILILSLVISATVPMPQTCPQHGGMHSAASNPAVSLGVEARENQPLGMLFSRLVSVSVSVCLCLSVCLSLSLSLSLSPRLSGGRARAHKVPANATLVFEVELMPDRPGTGRSPSARLQERRRTTRETTRQAGREPGSQAAQAKKPMRPKPPEPEPGAGGRRRHGRRCDECKECASRG